jgi:hypothetical protein
LSACSGAVGSPGAGGTVSASSTSGGDYTWWRIERFARTAALDAYVAANFDKFESFKNAPLGNVGIPMVMFRLFAQLFPEYWGPPATQMAAIGFGKDDYEPYRVLPLGVGFMPSTTVIPVPVGPVTIPVKLNVTALTCMGCHGGKVVGPNGNIQHIIGAPNTQFDQFRGAVFATVNDPRYTADNFRTALAATPVGFVYGDPALGLQETLERGIFMSPGAAEQFLGGLKAGVNAGAARFAQTLGAHTYAIPNAPNPSAPTPGYLDAIGAGIALIADPAILNTPELMAAALPAAPAMIDIMSVWSQSGRPAAQWDGSIPNAVHRNLAAEFGVIGDPAHLNMQNVDLTTPFTQNLPPTPYPFDVDRDAAARGQGLYTKYCSSCHYAGNATIFAANYVGTDANRANIWTDFSIGALRTVLRAACTDPVTCNNPDGSPIADDQIIRRTGGYMAIALDGIWARAPYLHNGSVPTLAALLTGDRPKTFYRGNVNYDQVNVGFVTSSGPGFYDTTLSGNSNVGHSTPDFLGDVDWKNEPGKLHDLLEYLKTL